MINRFREVWLCDFEFYSPPGEHPTPICMVAIEYHSGRTLRLGGDDLRNLSKPPFSVSSDTLFVAFFASAELSCFLALNWPLPDRILDLYAEFRCQISGLTVPCGYGLLGALACYGLTGIQAMEKSDMRDLAMRGGPYSKEEETALLDYCESDVVALKNLLPAMLPKIDLPRALLRGRYMMAVARMEYNGIPIDIQTLNRLEIAWESIQSELIYRLDPDGEIFENRTFKRDRWANWLVKNKISWPVLASGGLNLSDETFREMARSHPEVGPIRELRYTLSQLRLSNLSIGSDSRNRLLLSPFQSKTGRNQPSNSKFIFGPSCWLRSLIQPEVGYGLAYIDWSQQEFGIAAALSDDSCMKEAYSSGDPYLKFAIQAGAVPPDATKQSHAFIRDQFKACVLAVQYGMGEQSLAMRINQSSAKARELLWLHRDTFKKLWTWSDTVLDYAMLNNRLYTVFGWQIHVGTDPNPRSLRNFPMQANGAEMLRLACCLATERGVRVCAPIHDAILIEAPLEDLDTVITVTQAYMAEASRIVLEGFELRTDVEVVRYPNRYMDERGRKMWDTVQSILSDIEESKVGHR